MIERPEGIHLAAPRAPGPRAALHDGMGRAPRRGRRTRVWARVAGGAAALLLLLWLAHAPLLTAAARVLTVEDEPAPAELIFQFGGDWLARSRLAAELYHRGIAPRVVLMRVEQSPDAVGIVPHETELTVRLLTRLGVPRSAITVYRSGDGVGSTTEEAEALTRVLRSGGTSRIVAVTSWFHTRRARWALRRALDGAPVEVAMAAAATPGYDATNWWKGERGMIVVFEEYLKFAHNWLYR